MDTVKRLLEDLRATGFYGQLELNFQDGRVVLIRRIESIKPESFGAENRHDYRR